MQRFRLPEKLAIHVPGFSVEFSLLRKMLEEYILASSSSPDLPSLIEILTKFLEGMDVCFCFSALNRFS